MQALAIISRPADGPWTQEARVVVVRRGAGADAIVAARAAVEVNDHRGRAVKKTVLGEKFENFRADFFTRAVFEGGR